MGCGGTCVTRPLFYVFSLRRECKTRRYRGIYGDGFNAENPSELRSNAVAYDSIRDTAEMYHAMGARKPGRSRRARRVGLGSVGGVSGRSRWRELR